MGKQHWLALVMAGALAACGQAPQDAGTATSPGSEPAAGPVDAHSSRDSLDWPGAYEGLLPCTDCAGVLASLALAADGTYSWSTRRLGAGEASLRQDGRFTWSADGGSITLDPAAKAPAFQVGEGRLLALNADGSRPEAGAASVLHFVPAPAAAPSQVLEANTWSLVGATNAGNARLDAFFPDPGHGFGLSFAGGRLLATGGCNGLRAGYQLTPEGQFTVSAGAATMMACAPPLMAADAALSAFLSLPLQLVLAQGPAPSLALIASTGEVLVFQGQPTMESRYGPASIAFYEVGPLRLPCEGAASGDGLCLQVREISFDDQGLRVGEPGEFQPFAGTIEGYEHTEGTRNVIRVKRFQSDATPPGGVKVLDLVVESEQVPQ